MIFQLILWFLVNFLLILKIFAVGLSPYWILAYTVISESGCLTFNVVSFSWYLFCLAVLGSSGSHVFFVDPVKWVNCARELRASCLEHQDCCSHHLQTCFAESNVVRQFDSRFLSFWFATWGSPEFKTFAVNVGRQRRKVYPQNFAKIVVIRSPPLFFWDMGGNLSAEIYKETPVTAVIFLRITGGTAIFSPPIRRYRGKISVKISTRDMAILSQTAETLEKIGFSENFFFLPSADISRQKLRLLLFGASFKKYRVGVCSNQSIYEPFLWNVRNTFDIVGTSTRSSSSTLVVPMFTFFDDWKN